MHLIYLKAVKIMHMRLERPLLEVASLALPPSQYVISFRLSFFFLLSFIFLYGLIFKALRDVYQTCVYEKILTF